MKKIKYLYFDLDGTILNEKKIISPNFVSYVNKLKAANYQIGIATGRHEIMSRHICAEIQPQLPLLTINGCSIFYPDKKVETLYPLSFEIVKDICSFIEKLKGEYFIYNESKMFTNNLNNWRIKQFVESFKIQNQSDLLWPYYQVNWEEVKKDKCLKILCITINTFTEIKTYIKSNYPEIDVISSEHGILDIYDKRSNKYLALQKVIKDLKINGDEELIFFGDNNNDYEALKYLKNTVCVGSNFPHINKVAKYTALSSDEDGVYLFLKKHFPV